MSDKQKAMRERLNELSKENHEILERRRKRDEEKAESTRAVLLGAMMGSEPQGFGREVRRTGSTGIPRSAIYSQRMTMPKKRRRK